MKNTLSAICDSIEQQYMVENPQYGSYLREFLDEFESTQVFHGHEIKRAER